MKPTFGLLVCFMHKKPCICAHGIYSRFDIATYSHIKKYQTVASNEGSNLGRLCLDKNGILKEDPKGGFKGGSKGDPKGDP